jgi:ribosomal protein S18 acetylase RimI-like enzyme
MIRLANVNDAKAIATIHVLSWQKIYRGHIPDATLDDLSIIERQNAWMDLMNNGVKIILIEQDNLIVGFASICASRDEDTNPNFCGEISAIYLHPDFWRKGLGTKLCESALAELKNHGSSEVILWVLNENVQARKFYESLGFHDTGDIKKELYEKDVSLNEVRYKKKI